MKEILFKFFIAAMVAVATMLVSPSCQKEMAGTQDLVKEGETIQVSINAGLGGFVAADATKATATPVVRFEWESTDKVDAYYGNNKISGTDGISVEPSENKIFAKLSGTITAPSGHTFGDDDIITFVYSNGCTVENNLTFNFSNQVATIPFVAYATVKWSEIKSGLTDKMVEFKFATSVMKIAATGLDGSEISSATIDGIYTKVTLTPSESSETCGIAESNKATITKTAGFDTSSDNTRAIFTVGLVPDDNTSRKLTINGTEAALTSSAIEGSKSYTTPCAFETDEYVVMNMKKSDGSTYTLKWATKNLGANTVKDFGKLYSWGNLAGQRGDSFDPPFDDSSYNSTQGKSISKQDDWKMEKHDAAYNEWGGSWRMPTSQDFVELANACRSTGYTSGSFSPTSEDTAEGVSAQGVYWCSNYSGSDRITGLLFCDGTNKLFFPAAGYSNGASRLNGGVSGNYWLSTWSDASNEYNFSFSSQNVHPYTYTLRYYGRSVRPVSCEFSVKDPFGGSEEEI